MYSRASVKTSKTQQGLALLIFVIVIFLAFASYLMSGLSINQVRVDQVKQTRIALEKAKQALIAYAVTYGDRDGVDAGQDADQPGVFGFLPCPDVDAGFVEGGSDDPCGAGNINSMGLFPWASLETGVLNSSSGNCLWYAVSGEYKRSNPTAMLNEDTNGGLLFRDSNGAAVPGVNAEDRIVAVIIDPSLPLAAQSRSFDGTSTCGLDYAAAEYLEGDGVYDNATLSGVAFDVDDFINAGVGSDELVTPFNDQVVTITRDEIWSAIVARSDFNSKMKNLTEALAVCLSKYAISTNIKRLPWAAPIGLADYRVNNNYDDSDGTIEYSGRIPYVVDNSNAKMLAAGSTDLFDYAGCDNLPLPTAGITVDLVNDTEYRSLWNNWKDHFFYVLSGDFELDDLATTVALVTGARDAISVANDAIAVADAVTATAAAADAITEANNAVASAVDATASAAALAAAAITPGEIVVANSEVASAANMTLAVTAISVAAADVATAAPILDVVAANTAVTDANAAVVAAEAAAEPECLPANTPINCIKVDPSPIPAAIPTEKAGVIIFSGSRQIGQLRNEPIAGDPDTKQLVTNYIENNNDGVFPDNSGNGYYEIVGAGSNDIMFCIETDLSVIECL